MVPVPENVPEAVGFFHVPLTLRAVPDAKILADHVEPIVVVVPEYFPMATMFPD
jgi:hypothetical protein